MNMITACSCDNYKYMDNNMHCKKKKILRKMESVLVICDQYTISVKCEHRMFFLNIYIHCVCVCI